MLRSNALGDISIRPKSVPDRATVGLGYFKCTIKNLPLASFNNFDGVFYLRPHMPAKYYAEHYLYQLRLVANIKIKNSHSEHRLLEHIVT
jgi:hypothetical protein